MPARRAQAPHRLLSLLWLIGLLLPTLNAAAQFGGAGQVTPSLIAETNSAQPGKPVTVAVHFDIKDKWHLYWTNPEGDGFAPDVQWDLPEGYTVSEPRWPAPHHFKFLESIQFGYENQLTLLFDITPPNSAAGDATLNAGLTWLVCDSGNCVPNTGYPDPVKVSLTLPIRQDKPEPSDHADTIKAAEAAVPKDAPEGWSFSTRRAEGGFAIQITAPTQADAAALKDLYFYSNEQFLVDPEAEPGAKAEGRSVLVTLPRRTKDPYGEPLDTSKPVPHLSGVLTAQSGFGDPGIKAIRIRGPIDADTDAGPDRQGNERPGDPTGKPTDAQASDAGTGTKAGGDAPIGFALALGMAFVGGLILNLMPCVFPVLSIKILGFVQQAGEHPAVVRKHGYAFGAGVMMSFWVLVGVLLALREIAQAAADAGSAAGSVGWGFQLQDPVFVLAMLILVFLIGLNLIGAFEVGVGLSAAAGRASQGAKDGYGKSFFTGVLATLIATPCTGPFMAPALGAAIAMPTLQAFLVFTALGLGMATPYVVLSCFPTLLNYLPRPGAWMESFKQAMAFPMFATAGWLAWVYISLVSDDFGLPLLVGLAVIAMGAWVYGRWSTPSREPSTRWIARGSALILVAGSAVYLYTTANRIEAQRVAAEKARAAGEYVYEWVDFSPETVEQLRTSGRPVLVDFTASWCFICQTNKKTSLRTSAAKKLYEQYNVALVEADNTRTDPRIARVLEQYNRAGVPLYLVFPADDPDAEPEVLPEVLTPQIVADAIKHAANSEVKEKPSLSRR